VSLRLTVQRTQHTTEKDMDPSKKPRTPVRRRCVSDDRQMIELVAYRTWGDGGWRSVRDVMKDLKQLGHDISVGGVVSCVKAAVDTGMVTVVPNLEHELADVSRLELLLQGTFKAQGIKRVRLVPGHPEMLKDVERDRLRQIHTEVTHKLARRAAEYAYELLADAARAERERPFRIGVAWGRTLHAFAQQLLASPPRTLPDDVKVYPIVGITDAEQALPVEANGIASIVARAVRGVSAQLQCPAIVRSDQYELATGLDQVQRTLSVIREKLDLVFTGMGPIEYAQGASDITISPDPDFNEKLFESAKGASGEMCFWCFREDGRAVTGLPYRSIGLELDGLRRIASDANGRRVVLITGGDKRRIPPLKAAIRGRLVSDIVTDTITARALLGEIASS
jgi:DNA-binding transcriptional regulator LsrR (DeoR family)